MIFSKNDEVTTELLTSIIDTIPDKSSTNTSKSVLLVLLCEILHETTWKNRHRKHKYTVRLVVPK